MHHLIYSSTVKDWNCFFFLYDKTPAPCWGASFKTQELQPVFQCVRISIHLESRHVKPPRAHQQVDLNPISRQGQLDLKLFSDAVRWFIPTTPNLHGAFSVLSSIGFLVKIERVWGRSVLLRRLEFPHWVWDWLAVTRYWFPLAYLVHSNKPRVNPLVPHTVVPAWTEVCTNTAFWPFLLSYDANPQAPWNIAPEQLAWFHHLVTVNYAEMYPKTTKHKRSINNHQTEKWTSFTTQSR